MSWVHAKYELKTRKEVTTVTSLLIQHHPCLTLLLLKLKLAILPPNCAKEIHLSLQKYDEYPHDT
jgi:hypothetical protein